MVRTRTLQQRIRVLDEEPHGSPPTPPFLTVDYGGNAFPLKEPPWVRVPPSKIT